MIGFFLSVTSLLLNATATIALKFLSLEDGSSLTLEDGTPLLQG